MASTTASPARSLLLACVAWLVAWPAAAATVNLFQSTVPQAGRGEAAQAAAFQEAMRDVLIRVTGSRDAPAHPALVPLVNDARRYVQTFRPGGAGLVTVSFDAQAIENAVASSGLPFWGRDRPTVLVWLVVDRGPAQRSLVTATTPGEDRRAVERAAAQRGLVLAWPAPASPAERDARVADVLAGRHALLAAEGGRSGADGVLIGRATAGAGGVLAVGWTFLDGAVSPVAQGGLGDGVHLAADRYAASQASTSAARISEVAVQVVGVAGVADYAAVTRALEALSMVRAVAVAEVARDQLSLRVTLRGDAAVLRRALARDARFAPLDAAGAALAFQWRP